MKALKPLKLGMLPKPYFFAGRNYLCTSTFLFFRLGKGGNEPEVIPEHAAWPMIHRTLPAGVPLDFGMGKQRAEWLLAGQAFAPNGRPTRKLNVRAQLAGIEKTLRVRGDRRWQYSLVPTYQETQAEPFVSLPLTYERAFGGEGCASNPVGRGYHAQRLAAFHGKNEGTLPNLEYPNSSVKAGKGPYPAANFLPLPFGHPSLQKKAGTYNKHWLKQDYPGLARDADWSLFNVAPLDQQLPKPRGASPYFLGGEAYELTNLHPEQVRICGELPKVRARTLFARRVTCVAR